MPSTLWQRALLAILRPQRLMSLAAWQRRCEAFKGCTFKSVLTEAFNDLSAKWDGQRAKLGNTMQAIDDLEAGLMARNGSPTHTSNDLRQRLVSLLENEMADNNYGLLTLRGGPECRNRLSKMMKAPGAYNTASMDEGQIQYLRNALKADYRAAISDPADLAKLDAHNQWYSGQKAMRRNLDGIPRRRCETPRRIPLAA